MTDENKADRKTASNADLGQKELQKTFDEAEDKGLLGTEVDPTPNENYTVAGVTSGAPTPETDQKAADAAQAVTTLRRSDRS